MSIVERIESARHRDLPSPCAGRFKPLRAGIINVWEYDEQEFWFADGRLVLRGQNTAGKSKALELLLPFVLDGDLRPERLDPFGNRSRTMYWNLIDFDEERRSEVGYCWLEFGRVNESGAEQFVSVIVGMRATRSSRNVDKWFAVTPGRVGGDVDLVPDRRPATRDQLKESLGPDCVRESAHEHRTAVDRALFGLGSDRYDALIHLILQLRRPKLSEKLRPDTLAEHLTDALPPLDRDRVRRLAEAFSRLDADAAELEALEASSREVRSFLDAYRDYARIQVRLRADAVRAASTAVHNVTRTERAETERHDAAKTELDNVERLSAETATAITTLTGQLQGLDLTKVHALKNIVALAADTETHAVKLETIAELDERVATDAERELESRRQEASRLLDVRANNEREADAAAQSAGIDTEHGAHTDQLRQDPAAAGAALDEAAERRRVLLTNVRAAATAAEAARQRIDRAVEAESEANDRLTLAAAELDQAVTHVETASIALASAIDRWPNSLEEDVATLIDRARIDGATVVASIAAARGSARPAIEAVRAAAAAGVASLNERGVALAIRTSAIASDLAALRAERNQVASEADDAPSGSPGRPAERPATAVALWQCVDFAPGTDAATAAAVEAALEAAGLLDALVTERGLTDPTSLDTVIVSADVPRELSAARWLVPAEGSPLPESEVSAAIVAIGAGRQADRGCWIDADGSWANGALAGRWSKADAEFVGAAARSARRKRRLADLDERITDAQASLDEGERSRDELRDLQLRYEAALLTFPSTDALAEVTADMRAAHHEVALAELSVTSAATALAQARDHGRASLDALHSAETAAGCVAIDAASALDALDAYRRRLAALVAAATAFLVADREVGRASERATDARTRAHQAAIEAEALRALATERIAEADELRRVSGAEVDQLLARQTELADALAEVGRTRDALVVQDRQARDQMIRAETLLAEAVQRRVEAEAKRLSALSGQAEVCATELAALALGVVADRDVTQVSAGLAFARAAFEKLREVEVDQRSQDEVDNRLHNSAYPRLRSRLAADFDPHLDVRDGIHVFVARLGGEVVGAAELDAALAQDVERRQRTLTAEERDIVDRHLVTELGTHLGERAHGAWDLVNRMNRQLAEHPTRAGVALRLKWEPSPELSPVGGAALRLLRQDVALLDATQRETLNAFLTDRVRQAREDTEGGDAIERLSNALDYRRWHTFQVHRRSPDGTEQRFTAKTQSLGSGGEQAKLAHLPLFAAVAGYYASALATAPHLLVLDEAFAGIDEDQRGDCMAMLVDLDLDIVLANYAEWGCYPQIPAVAVYHLERTPGRRGVAALRFVWNGTDYNEDDPFLDGQTNESDGLFAALD